MPELPEVETVRRYLEKNIVGEKALKIQIKNKKLRYEIPKDLNKIITNTILTKILRRGKYLIFLYKNNFAMLSHLGMTGYFRIDKKIKKKKHDHFSIFFGENVLTYNDVRKFGFVKVYPEKNIEICDHLKNLGPEPFSKDLNLDYIKKKIIKRKNIKNFLMNQNVIAGLGNIYCSEILYDAQINPQRVSRDLKNEEIRKLIFSIKKILQSAIKMGGTTIKNFIVPDVKVGYFKNRLQVYGRLGKRCFRCGNEDVTIKKIVQSGRASFFCEKCQL